MSVAAAMRRAHLIHCYRVWVVGHEEGVPGFQHVLLTAKDLDYGTGTALDEVPLKAVCPPEVDPLRQRVN